MRFAVKEVAIRLKEICHRDNFDEGDCSGYNDYNDYNDYNCHDDYNDCIDCNCDIDDPKYNKLDGIYQKLTKILNLTDDDTISLGMMISLIDSPYRKNSCYKINGKNMRICITIYDHKNRSTASIVGEVNGSKINVEIQLLGSSGLTVSDYLFYNSMTEQGLPCKVNNTTMFQHINKKIKKGLIDPFKLLDETVCFTQVLHEPNQTSNQTPNQTSNQTPNQTSNQTPNQAPNKPSVLTFFNLYKKHAHKNTTFIPLNSSALIDVLLPFPIKVSDTKTLDILEMCRDTKNDKPECETIHLQHVGNGKYVYVSSDQTVNIRIDSSAIRCKRVVASSYQYLIKCVSMNTIKQFAITDRPPVSLISQIIPEVLDFEINTIINRSHIVVLKELPMDCIVDTYVKKLCRELGCDDHNNYERKHESKLKSKSKLIDMHEVCDKLDLLRGKVNGDITKDKTNDELNVESNVCCYDMLSSLTQKDLVDKLNCYVYTLRNIVIKKPDQSEYNRPKRKKAIIMDVDLYIHVESD
jgi:hypothetical protein